MDKYRFLLEIDGKKIEFTCKDDSEDFMKFLNYAYEEFNLDKEAEIKILDKEKVR
ncbi:hypothetical protein [Clostridium sp. UBA5988]|uniref:hypothetical protein n=1 Tax=Clostridium sp. UBA5988 TaxID=1946369 RepID=UPI003216B21C